MSDLLVHRISIVIPEYRSEKTAPTIVAEIATLTKYLSGIQYKILATEADAMRCKAGAAPQREHCMH